MTLSMLCCSLQAYLFDDYWEDIGTIKSFFDANLALTAQVCIFPPYNSEISILHNLNINKL